MARLRQSLTLRATIRRSQSEALALAQSCSLTFDPFPGPNSPASCVVSRKPNALDPTGRRRHHPMRRHHRLCHQRACDHPAINAFIIAYTVYGQMDGGGNVQGQRLRGTRDWRRRHRRHQTQSLKASRANEVATSKRGRRQNVDPGPRRLRRHLRQIARAANSASTMSRWPIGIRWHERVTTRQLAEARSRRLRQRTLRAFDKDLRWAWSKMRRRRHRHHCYL